MSSDAKTDRTRLFRELCKLAPTDFKTICIRIVRYMHILCECRDLLNVAHPVAICSNLRPVLWPEYIIVVSFTNYVITGLFCNTFKLCSVIRWIIRCTFLINKME